MKNLLRLTGVPLLLGGISCLAADHSSPRSLAASAAASSSPLVELANRIDWKDGAVLVVASLIGWLAMQLKQSHELRLKSEELRQKADEARAKAESARAEAEQKALDWRNAQLEFKEQIPSIVARETAELQSIIDDKLVKLGARIKEAQIRLRQLEAELFKLRDRVSVNDDEMRRLSDEIQNACDEIEEVNAFATSIEAKSNAIAQVREILSSGEFNADFIEAGEKWLNKRLRLQAAERTTARVVERTAHEIATTAAATTAKFRAMEERLAQIERKIASAHLRVMRRSIDG